MQQHCYLVSYDLCQPGRNYNELYNVLKGYEHWGQLTESFWAIISTKNEVVPIALKRYHRSVVSGTIIALRAVPPVSL